MRICLVSQEYPPETGGGGIGTQTYLKAQGLSIRGHEVHVLAASWDHERHDYEDGLATIHRIPYPELRCDGFEESTSWLAYSTAVAEELWRLQKELSFDIIQFPEYGGEGFIFQTDTFRYRTSKYVVQMHGPLAMFAMYMGWPDPHSTFFRIGSFMEQMVLHHADKLLASSLNTALFCERYYRIQASEAVVIHSAVDTHQFAPLEEQSQFGPRLLFVGNLAGNKGAGASIQAVVRLIGEFPEIRCRLIGRGDSDYVRSLQAMVKDGGAERNVDFLGYVPYKQLPKHYQWCDFFVGPSIFEPGPGNIYLEAMACGKPVIACSSGGTPEVVIDGQTGLLVPPGDCEALTNAIRSLSSDLGLRRKLGTAARRWVEDRFGIDAYLDRVETVYRGVQNGKG